MAENEGQELGEVSAAEMNDVTHNVADLTLGGATQPSDIDRLRRFLCLGSEGGTYSIQATATSPDNSGVCTALIRLIGDGSGQQAVDEIVKCSKQGQSANREPVIFALAMCARSTDATTKSAGYGALEDVCCSSKDLLTFVRFSESLSSKGTGWGRSHRSSIARWYNNTPVLQLARQLTVTRRYSGWSHADVLRLAHVKPDNEAVSAVLKFIMKGAKTFREEYSNKDVPETVRPVVDYLLAVDSCLHANNEKTAANLILQYELMKEHIPTPLLNSKQVWGSLLTTMPLENVLQNLIKMTRIGLLTSKSPATKSLTDRLCSEQTFAESSLHPFTLLSLLKIYEEGKTGRKTKTKWTPVPEITQALMTAFHLSFKFLSPIGKRFLLAIDVSSSMEFGVLCGCQQLRPRHAAATMAMGVARTESNSHIMAFSTQLIPIPVNQNTRLDEILQSMTKMSMGTTDCALPMLWALNSEVPVDVFIVFTDSDTVTGNIHPTKALQDYRKLMGIDAKLIVCGLTSKGFTISDASDLAMLDMVGFDWLSPQVIRNFASDCF